eukprot:TRINITY_DN33747_c0_g1_i1.p1 TRINITY_DN33747_c0_g1~~TRINITY_DN33747_c0_g1_i1.p1  ORF type:complete len:109 (+),score=7.09 TRINITY_DN33747_c0_g1_i1:60-386(+)
MPELSNSDEWNNLGWLEKMRISAIPGLYDAMNKGYNIHMSGGSRGCCRISSTALGDNNSTEQASCKDNVFCCDRCSKSFCGYHSWVNNSTAFGSFGGHVCSGSSNKYN